MRAPLFLFLCLPLLASRPLQVEDLFKVKRVADPQVAAYLLSLRFWDFVIIALGAFFAARTGARLLAQPMPGVEEGDEQKDKKDYKDPKDA